MHDDRSMSLVVDVRQAARSYLESPGSAAILVLTIGVGAGGDAAILAFAGGFSAHVAATLSTADRLEFARVRMLLFAASGLILLLAGATVAGLRLSTASARTRETAIRVSLGASRRRLAWQSLLESALVAVGGGGVAAVAHLWTSHLVPMLLFAEDAERLTWSPDWTTLTLTTLVWVGVIAACGLVPTLVIRQDAPIGVLKGDRPSMLGSPNRFRRWLVVAQIGLCVLLVEGAGVIREDLHQALRTPRARVLASLAVTRVQAMAPSSDGTGGLDYFTAVQAAVQHVPSVAGTAWIATLPGSRAISEDVVIESPPLDWRELRFDVTTFPTAVKGAPRVHAATGRLFQYRDGPAACRVAVINTVAANRYFNGDAIGRLVQAADGRLVHIIGVVERTGGREARPVLYYSSTQVPEQHDTSLDVAFKAPAGDAPRRLAAIDVNVVSPDYFHVFADKPLGGRALTSDDRAGDCRVGVISAEAARTLFDGRAIGGAVIDPDGDRIEVVGVVGDETLGAAQRGGAPAIFFPLSQAYTPTMTLAARTAASMDLSVLDRAVRRIPGGTVWESFETMESHMTKTALAPERIAAALLGACAMVALIVSVAGVYAVMADLVLRRRRELALRLALGAQPWALVFSRGGVVSQALRLGALGVLIGAAGAAVGTPLLSHLVMPSRLPAPLVVVTAGAAVAGLVLIASALPAWRAVRVDPRGLIQDAQ